MRDTTTECSNTPAAVKTCRQPSEHFERRCTIVLDRPRPPRSPTGTAPVSDLVKSELMVEARTLVRSLRHARATLGLNESDPDFLATELASQPCNLPTYDGCSVTVLASVVDVTPLMRCGDIDVRPLRVFRQPPNGGGL